MLYFLTNPTTLHIRVTEDTDQAARWRAEGDIEVTRHNLRNYTDAEALAAQLNERAGETCYLPVD